MTVQAYHGTPNDFEEFSLNFLGTQSGTSGAGYGLYFSESESEAFTYGENVFKCTLKLKQSISNYEVTFNENLLYKILKLLNDNGYNFFEKYYSSICEDEDNFEILHFPTFDNCVNILKEIITDLKTDTEIIYFIVKNDVPVQEVFNILIKLGCNHTVDNDESFLANEGIKHYIMYDISDINILDKYTLEDRGINSNSMSISPRKNIFKNN